MSDKEKDSVVNEAAGAEAEVNTEPPSCDQAAPEEQAPPAAEQETDWKALLTEKEEAWKAMLAEKEEAWKAMLAEQEDKLLRLAAEFDNFRKRTQREKETLWTQAQAETVLAFLPVYDNLERALKQETIDKAYAKGVEMTMNQLKEILKKLGVEEIPSVGHPFDPTVHNAIMHIEDESLEKNVVVETFQTGFKLGEKVIRVAMVKVAN